jgi:hypothetical protein
MQKISCPATKFYFWAGETPTPQEIIVIGEQASCLFLKENNFIVEQASCLFLKEVQENPRIFG